MNCYTYDDIKIGQEESFAVKITDDMMSHFYDITGDCNPLHSKNENNEKLNDNPNAVVFGMLTASFLSTLAGVYLPGKYSLIQKVDVDFLIPVYSGEVITFYGEVINKNDPFKVIEIKVTAINSANKKVLRGKMRAGVRQ